MRKSQIRNHINRILDTEPFLDDLSPERHQKQRVISLAMKRAMLYAGRTFNMSEEEQFRSLASEYLHGE